MDLFLREAVAAIIFAIFNPGLNVTHLSFEQLRSCVHGRAGQFVHNYFNIEIH